ncbi:sodium/glutamate symporter [Paraburkholderia caballeronis]|uniref:sodium/glutamate symporter n=1 Tax=Paraburkholderia caballeronis TaxID=416943 RepID=UPI0010665C42|nr:sodium/glutamate symporter [Paraburkholderia caballeronis]TDV15082.1 ESS family glutamate:Na+ symporter [Paraburkholderia caballeronis]TDV16793.1 ESS family glutamate:Na+ symporter [Paraburkholderia caballeronis]TDV25818.1 ESS family glutamate:Na+ symporter [Paraburkholderia caballeronis]TDV34456.1 ESS family glutamate:Na+ symporter [Paraburkholderia caballeronis]
MTVSVYATLVAASLVLLLGNRLLAWIPQLRAWTIPEPVAGGLVVALALLALHAFAHFDVRFDTALQTPLMFTFFATIGLNAKLASLKQGGPVLVRFLAVVVGLLILQNVVGVGLALAFGIDPLYGLLGGSVSLAGGHGTGAAWGAVFTEHHGLQSATEAAIACATFGLVMGGILGGPVAQRLMKRLGSASAPADTETHAPDAYAFEEPRTEQATTPAAFIDTVMLIAFSLWVGELISDAIAGSAFELPTFVCVLFVAVLVSNGLAWAGKPVAAHAVALIANVSLALFLAMALMTLRLWDLAALALPVATILLAQTVMMVVYAFYVTFRAMGSDYDAVVLTAGHCGFGLGATPTAIANMQAVTARFGHSHLAFLIVPMVAAFFIDIANAIVIQLFLRLPVFH